VAVSVGTIEARLDLRDRMSQQLALASKKVTAFGRQMSTAGKKLQAFGSSTQAAGMSMLPLTAAIVGLGAVALVTFADFESKMNRVRAVTGATGEDFEALEATARELGATTVFTAREAAEAMGFFGLAGFKVNEIIGAMPGALQLAAAAQIDVGAAADVTAKIMRGYGRDVSEVANQNDVLVKAFTTANTDLTQLGNAFKMAGPVAHVAGIEFEETAAALSLMADAGFQGTLGGTALRAAIARLGGAVPAVSKDLAEMGVVTQDTTGKMLPFADILEQLEAQGLEAGEIMALFGLRAGPAMAALLDRGADSLRDFTGELHDVQGVAGEIAGVQLEGLRGEFILMKSAVEGASIALGETLEPAATAAVGYLRDMALAMRDDVIPAFNDLQPVTKTVAGGMLAFIASVGPGLLALGATMRIVGFSLAGVGITAGSAGKLMSFLRKGLGQTTLAMLAMLRPAGLILAAFATGFFIGDLLKNVRLLDSSVFSLSEAFEFGFIKLDNWMRGIEMSDDAIQEAITSRGRLKAATDEEADAALEAAKANQEFAAALEEERLAALADVDGLGELGKGLGGVTGKTKGLSDEVNALIDSLGGAGLLAVAQDTETAIAAIGGVEKLTTEQTAAYAAQVNILIERYRALGGPAGAQVIKHYEGVLATLPKVGLTLAEINDQFGTSRFGANTLGKGLKTLARESMGLDKDGLAPVRHSMDMLTLATDRSIPILLKWSGAIQHSATEGVSAFSEALSQLPNVVMGALQGGGSVLKSVGSLFGSSLTKSIFGGEAMQAGISTMFGATIGGALNSILPGIGALAGPLIGKIAGLFGQSQGSKDADTANESLRTMRMEILKTYGSLQNIRDMGGEAGEALADAWGSQNVKGLAHFKKQLDAFTKSIEADKQAVEDFLSSVSGAFKELTSSGALVTREFRQVMESIEEMGNTAEVSAYKLSQIGRAANGMATLIQNTMVTTQGVADGLTSALDRSFREMVANGMSAGDAISQLSPAILALQADMDASGLTGSAAFDKIRNMALIAASDINGPLLAAVHGSVEAMAGLHNAGILDQEMFVALANQATQAFQQMVDGGADGQAALQLIAPDLQKIWELQQEFGYEVDDSTQKLIDQAIQAGLVGESHRDASQVATKAMEDAAKALERVADILSKMFEDAGNSSETFAERARRAVNSIPSSATTTHTINTVYTGGPDTDYPNERGPQTEDNDQQFPAFKDGGDVTATGFALVHKGETVTPAGKSTSGVNSIGEHGVGFNHMLGELRSIKQLLRTLPETVAGAAILAQRR